MKLTLTPTRAQLGARCHRRHALTDLARLVKSNSTGHSKKAKNEHAAFGTVIHAGASAFWAKKRDLGPLNIEVGTDTSLSTEEEVKTLAEHLDGPRNAARKSVEDVWAQEFTGDTKDYSLELALSMIDGYTRKAERTPISPGEWVTAGIEERLTVQIGRFTCSFMIDRWFVDHDEHDSRLLFVDTKTTKTLRAGWSKGYDVSVQMKLYKYCLWKKYGIIPDGVIEGVSKKVPTDIEYHLLPDWDPSILDEAAAQFLRIAEADEQLVQVATENGVLNLDLLWELSATQTAFNDNDCYAYGQPCPFLEVCAAPVEQRLGLLKDSYFVGPEPDYLE